MKKLILTLIVPTVAITLSGCGRSGSGGAAQAQAATNTPTQVHPRKVVVGVDVSSSYYQSVKRAQGFLAAMFKANARPGDTWVFRTIDVGSYADGASIPVYQGRAQVQLPKVPPAPQNPFNRQGRNRHHEQMRAFVRLRDAIAQGIQNAQLSEEKRGTDIYGFLRKAADLKATHIVIFTDLEDNQNQRVDIDLNGATVIVVLLHRADVKKSRELQQRWTEEFKRMNAGSVTYIDHDHDPAQVLKEVAHESR